MDKDTFCNISQFSDDTKIFNEVGSNDGFNTLQSSLDKLNEWVRYMEN